MNTKLFAMALLATLATSKDITREKRSPAIGLGLGPLELVYSHGIGAAPGQAGRLVVEPPSLNRVPTRVPPATRYPATARRLPTIENYNARPANRPTVWLEPNEDWPEDTEGDIFAYVPHVG